MKTIVIAAAALAALTGLSANRAQATTMFPEKFTCPIGGEKFESYVIGSYSSFGSRPDGRSYGTLPIMPVIECPGNGFILIDEKFTKTEKAILTATVASAEYQAMRAAQTPHYRAWHLMKAIGRPAETLASTLLEASWETDEDPERKAGYQRLYIAAVDALSRPDAGADAQGQSKGWFFLNLRAANAARELGDFAAATARLDMLARNVAAAGLGPGEVEEKAALDTYMKGLARLSAEGNAWFEPATLVPLDMAIGRCAMAAPVITASEREVCEGRPLADRRAELARYRREAEAAEQDATAAAH